MAIWRFLAIIERGSEGFGVTFPDFPGCTSYGNTIQEAAEHAEEALAGHVGLMLADGDPIPIPSDLDDVPIDPEVDEIARILVRINLYGKARRLNISLDEGLLAEIDAAAAVAGMSRSAFLAESARLRLSKTA
ncbi:MAG: type II toxin-antitoxin system HicB family antitoxin [Magnetococcales bacterium]|nr:type II toxin-antitoxin system HicB family antitoxin [Magnetococcales bacterium]